MDNYERAMQLHRAGQLREAEVLYRQTLSDCPNHAHAWFLLSALSMTRGDNTSALDQLERALQISPANPAYYCNLGMIHLKAGRNDAAAAALLQALSLKPDLVEAHHNLGLVLRELGDTSAAVACFERAAELAPDLSTNQHQLAKALVWRGELRRAIGHYLCALVRRQSDATIVQELSALLEQLGRRIGSKTIAATRRQPTVRCDDAGSGSLNDPPTLSGQSERDLLERCRGLRRAGGLEMARRILVEAIELRPDWLEAVVELGSIFEETGELDAAILCLEQALDLQPFNGSAQMSLARALVQRREPEVALGHLQCAVVLEPSSANTIGQLAALYHSLDRNEAAERLYRHALTLTPDAADLQGGLGSVLVARGHLDSALDCFARAIARAPESASAWMGRSVALFDLGLVDDAIAASRKAVSLSNNPSFHSALLFQTMYAPGVTAHEILEEARLWARTHVPPIHLPDAPHANMPTPDRRLRIGYVSPDFRDHCQAQFTIPLLSNHDHSAFEIHCYSTLRSPDDVTRRLQSLADVWHDAYALSDAQLAELVRRDSIDILVDLTMHMQNARPLVFAQRPAPIQVAWLAYPGTTGMTCVDYRFTDGYLDPASGDWDVYSEKSRSLPHSFWCYDPLTSLSKVGPLPASVTGRITFGCLNNFAKTNTGTFELWASVLRAIPYSRLLLLAPLGSARTRTLDAFERFGVERERIEFVGRETRATYLQIYQAIDICLDTFPYNGHTTSFDAAWMGVPVITLMGETAVGRAGAALAHHLDHPELVARTPEQFVGCAVLLCRDLERLSEMRAGLRRRLENSKLMDAPSFARDFECVLRELWKEWCSLRSPAT